MSAGVPLTDADREPWLALLRAVAERAAADSRRGVLVACSALRAYYRDILRGARAPPGSAPLPTYFVYIKGERDLLWRRISGRKGHYMKPNMLDSQLQTLESPEGEEGVVVVPLDATTEEQLEIAMRGLNELLPEPL